MTKKCTKILLYIITISIIIAMNTMVFASDRINMSYLNSGTMNDYREYIKNTKNSLNVVLPNLFNINQNGEVELNEVIDKKFVEDMHSSNIKVIPYISNHWDRELGRKALNNYIAYADEVVRIVKKLGLDGVNIDIENLTAEDKAGLVQFTKYLNEAMPKNITISMAVAANPNDSTEGWAGSYDYKELSKYLDTFIIMAYDQSYIGSPAGPVAGLPFVENSIKTMLKYTTPDKLILGIPFYGRYWNMDASSGGAAITNKLVNNVINTFNAKTYYDEYNQTPYIRFNVNNISTAYLVGGKKFSVGSYIMYYENDKSIKEKLILVEKYALAGSVSWALAQENTAIWNNYTSWLNGNYFDDIKASWARKDINAAAVRGYVLGANIYEFKPNDYITREEFAAIIFRIMGYSKVIVSEGLFKDVRANRWSYDYLSTLYSYGIIKGNNGYYNPSSYISRQEVAAMLYRILGGSITDNGIDFSDVNANMWSKLYIDYCTSIGVLSGYPDNTFRPEDKITREEIAAIIMNIKQ